MKRPGARRLLTALAVTSVVAAGGVVAVADPALAATGCGSACDGQDPSSYKIGPPYSYYYCADDAKTVKTASGAGESVELRYSPQCRTVWARNGSFEFWVERQSPHATEVSYPSNTGGDSWTAMLNDAGMLSRACVGVPYSDGGSVCTGWY